MDIESCIYCWNKLTIFRYSLTISCGHSICNTCLLYLKNSLNLLRCPYCLETEVRDIKDLPRYKLPIKLVNICQEHKQPFEYFSKITYKKLCLKCIKDDLINENDLEKRSNLEDHINEKFKELEKSTNNLLEEYTKRLENANIFENIYKKYKLCNEFYSNFNENFFNKKLDEKIEYLQENNPFEEEVDNSIEILSNIVNENKIELYNATISALGINREKSLLS